jgi:hypothetical protein
VELKISWHPKKKEARKSRGTHLQGPGHYTFEPHNFKLSPERGLSKIQYFTLKSVDFFKQEIL